MDSANEPFMCVNTLTCVRSCEITKTIKLNQTISIKLLAALCRLFAITRVHALFHNKKFRFSQKTLGFKRASSYKHIGNWITRRTSVRAVVCESTLKLNRKNCMKSLGWPDSWTFSSEIGQNLNSVMNFVEFSAPNRIFSYNL